MRITEYLKNNILFLDGGMGTLLQSKGLKSGELPERWNITHHEEITAVHKAYFDAGSNVVSTNTFGANSLKFGEKELEEIISSALNCAKSARDLTGNKGEKWVALDIGPTGKMLKPFGDLDFEDAVSVFSKTVKLGEKYGADLIFIETMNDIYETKAALLAAKESSDLPVFVSNAYSEDGKLLSGTSPAAAVALLEGMGADAIGLNCSFGPETLLNVADEYIKYASVPVLFKPNAGLPVCKDNETFYDVDAKSFAKDIKKAVEKGVRAVGGCCGTTPEYIKETVNLTKDIKPLEITDKNFTCVSSYSDAKFFGQKPLLIGERINPTGKKMLKSALISGDIDYVLKEGIKQQEKGSHILDVNVGLPEINEQEMLPAVIKELQTVSNLPLQIDTSDISAMEKALRVYNGKAMINSVNGKKESMESVFPLAKKYGGVIVALTLDESGIPATAEGRLKIAEKILSNARNYGIEKKNIVFDPLALTVSADKDAAKETLKAVKLIRENLGCHTVLGVSNVSFGLPEREGINVSFFTLALHCGLSGAIMNPLSDRMMQAYYSHNVLLALDENCKEYISFSENMPVLSEKPQTPAETLSDAIIKGLKSDAAAITDNLLKSKDGLALIKEEIIPALNKVGEGFEKKTVFLPQLLMSAEAAQSAFERIKLSLKSENGKNGVKFIIATVKGDIHDIGKNIVKLLLQNYGFEVYDLGKDVPSDVIAKKVKETDAPLLGLSALMTTTVPSMEETIKLVKETSKRCRIVVGGAVLSREIAEKIGADKYAKDAMETVRYAEEIGKGIV